ncbi:unnamed protein product [Phaedon cochleariae]|uniref:Uncharacterized protein n=1 Tax=Phaedon cochleariae TaxID=80249 RepID=A0A9P0GPQ6_PHACE|nr:unnamed protein product [Phaedon cochleariae]
MEDQNENRNSDVDWSIFKNLAISSITRKQEDPSLSLPLAPPPEDETYTKRNRRGTAIIFNHKNFTIEDCSARQGTDKDRDDLRSLLEELKFDVISHDDLTFMQIIEVLEVVSKMDHSESECLFIAVMSHGDKGILFAKDREYPTKRLWTFFSPIHCPSLAGKPKLFFIQACRGNDTDPGVRVCYTERDSFNENNKTYSIPVMADILVMYATVEGYFAWRDPRNGSYFIQSLVSQIRKHRQSKDLLSILTCVNREVAIGFTSAEPRCSQLDGKKEMCSIVSMLTRSYYLDDNEENQL